MTRWNPFSRGKKFSASLDDISVSFSGAVSIPPSPEFAGSQTWQTPSGDIIFLFCENHPPAFPVNQPTMAEFEQTFAAEMEKQSLTLVELGRRSIDGHACLGFIFSAPAAQLGNRGRNYFGNVVIPFRDHHYWIRFQCPESGITGVRETAALMDTIAALREEGVEDLQQSADLAAERIDGPEYDEQFPTHPLARARKLMAEASTAIKITDKLADAPSYEWPADPIN